MTVHLDLEILLALVEDLAIGPIRDVGLLESASHRPTTTLWGEEAYPGIDDKAAALLESIVRNHALVDGNKRLGWLAVVVFYGMNGMDLDAPEDPAYDLVIGVVEGRIGLAESAEILTGWR